MNPDLEINKKIEELQVLESHLQRILAQKQSVQIELNEIDNALEELKNSDEEAYKIVSGFMIKSTKDKLGNELKEKKKLFEMRMESVEKQEEIIEKNAEKLREEVKSVVSKGK
ncbi:MAG: prefoldin subunit beta [Nanoarchaeota archaeon]|nr:prefoldin subunit beta [Nanoarchaeota archaeon]MBU1051674.1 prefoldin subunit beta [Nanoarchaeota archaeon]